MLEQISAVQIPLNLRELKSESLDTIQYKGLDKIIEVKSLLDSEWNFYDEQDLHISLARTLSLRHHEIQAFLESLGRKIRSLKIGSISLEFDEWRLLANDNLKTSFLSLAATRRTESVLSLISTVDTVLESYGHPKYYDDPIIHASFAWIPKNVLPLAPHVVGTIDPPLQISKPITHIKCKIGKVTRQWCLEPEE